jgi:hypothetical protein
LPSERRARLSPAATWCRPPGRAGRTWLARSSHCSLAAIHNPLLASLAFLDLQISSKPENTLMTRRSPSVRHP